MLILKMQTKWSKIAVTNFFFLCINIEHVASASSLSTWLRTICRASYCVLGARDQYRLLSHGAVGTVCFWIFAAYSHHVHSLCFANVGGADELHCQWRHCRLLEVAAIWLGTMGPTAAVIEMDRLSRSRRADCEISKCISTQISRTIRCSQVIVEDCSIFPSRMWHWGAVLCGLFAAVPFQRAVISMGHRALLRHQLCSLQDFDARAWQPATPSIPPL